MPDNILAQHHHRTLILVIASLNEPDMQRCMQKIASKNDGKERFVVMSQQDIELVCRDCGQTFIFTAGEQEFYSQKGFLHTPVRCPECRQARKQSRASGNQNHERKRNSRNRLGKPPSGTKQSPH